ncbi:MAG: cysteine peptidase family C39 domain-containing protein [Candidatus Microgenomates bacterium]|jgi:ABC-type bacteriocin/lantibiotic exporter with double-glycine peptidase domain
MPLEKNPKTRRLVRRLLQLEDKVVGKPFPKMKRAKQVTSSHCGPAVIETLFSFLGYKVSQALVVRSIRAGGKIKSTGLNVDELGSSVKKLGKGKFVFWRKANSTISNLSLIVNKYQYPVGVEWQGVFYEYADGDNGHYCVVTRVNREAGYLRLADPFFKFAGVDRKFKLKDFEKRWWDVNIIGKKSVTDKKMLFIIAPKGENWPRKLGMKAS